MIRTAVAVALLLGSVSLADAGPRLCAKGNVCLKPQKEAVICCCRTYGGNMCCAEQHAACAGRYVLGCVCNGKYDDEAPISRVRLDR
jgi:hypothetical protein